MMSDPGRDRGLTLVELLVATSCLLIIALAAGALLTAAIRTNRDVSAFSGATKRGEVISRSIEAGVRNSSSYAIGAATANGQVLRARVAVRTDPVNVVWQCQGWYYDAIGHRVFTKTSDTALPAVTAAAQVASTWVLLASNIKLSSATSPMFGGASDRLQLEYVVTQGDVELVLVPNTIVRQIKVTGGTGPSSCF